jgi:type IV pilus assembly protein PilW
VGAGSDVLVVRYQPSAKNQDSGQSDGSIFDCSGSALDTAATSRNDVSINVFFVAKDGSTGEPTLSCYTVNRATTSTPVSRSKFEAKLAIVTGVENFQVLYGVQAVNPIMNTSFTSADDTIPHTYLRADQMVVDGDPNGAKTLKNWHLVRSLKVGLVLRGEANKQQERVVQTLYPFGPAKNSPSGATGSAFSSASDLGTKFDAPADGRFRSAESFTIHLRNAQGG